MNFSVVIFLFLFSLFFFCLVDKHFEFQAEFEYIAFVLKFYYDYFAQLNWPQWDYGDKMKPQ